MCSMRKNVESYFARLPTLEEHVLRRSLSYYVLVQNLKIFWLQDYCLIKLR
jgi:hypothetical protein